MRRPLLLLLAALAWPAPAEARHRRPFHVDPSPGVSAHYDNDRRWGPERDYACGGATYDNHAGTDFRTYFADILAGGNGTVVNTFQGCADYGFYGSRCNSGCGNGLRVRFDDGSVVLHCHMKNGSIVVGGGQRVSCGQKLGVSASSGNSTGPHVHWQWEVGGTAYDPYAGGCSNRGGGWVQQRGYRQAPGTDCETQCECSPGQVREEGCGRCGVRRLVCGGNCRWGGWSGCEREGPCSPGQARGEGCGRCGERRAVCGGNCQWGGWSGCEREGPCSPGQVQEEGCCDCGQTRRSCNGSCQWNGWSACAGADPPGPPLCATGLPGVCDEGRSRCVAGCLTCVQSVFPSDETCDDRDNDCDGASDEGSPTVLGDPPARWAARLVDASFPRHLPPGGEAVAWVVFRNVGRDTWKAGDTWLRADAPAAGHPSLLAPAHGWPAHDAVAVLARDVAPGDEASFVFPLATPGGGEVDLAETFSLVAPGGRAVTCPEGELAVTIASVATSSFAREEAPEPPPPEPVPEGCASFPAGALALLGALVRARRRPS